MFVGYLDKITQCLAMIFLYDTPDLAIAIILGSNTILIFWMAFVEPVRRKVRHVSSLFFEGGLLLIKATILSMQLVGTSNDNHEYHKWVIILFGGSLIAYNIIYIFYGLLKSRAKQNDCRKMFYIETNKPPPIPIASVPIGKPMQIINESNLELTGDNNNNRRIRRK